MEGFCHISTRSKVFFLLTLLHFVRATSGFIIVTSNSGSTRTTRYPIETTIHHHHDDKSQGHDVRSYSNIATSIYSGSITSSNNDELTTKDSNKQESNNVAVEVVMTTQPIVLDTNQIDFIMGYLNKHHTDFLKVVAEAFSSLGIELAKANAFSGGSMSILSSRIINIVNTTCITLEVHVKKRNEKETQQRCIDISLNSFPIRERERFYPSRSSLVSDDQFRLPIDDIIRRLCRIAWIVKKQDVTGKLIQLAIQLGGAGIGKLPENL
jgi:hypothetical protein